MIGRLFLFALLFTAGAAYGRSPPLNTIKLPPGFEIKLFAEDVPNARQMA